MIDMLVTELLNEHFNLVEPRPATAKSYTSIVTRFVRETQLELVQQFNNEGCQTVITDWKKAILNRASASTWNTYRRHMSAVVNTGVKLNVIDNNHFKLVRSEKVNTKIKTVELDEISTVIDMVNNGGIANPPWFWTALILFLYATGIRRRQLIGLRWCDIDFDKKVMRIRGEYNKNGCDHDLPISDVAMSQLYKIVKVTPRMSELGQVWNVTRFNNKYRGSVMSEDQITGTFRKISSRTGIKIGSHRLRHTFATMLASNLTGSGVVDTPIDLKTLQQLLTHASIQTTSIYIHPSLSSQAQLLETVPDLENGQMAKGGREWSS